MARGLDELIDWLVAETAYCGETGFRVADFVTAVSRFNGRSQPKTEAVDADNGGNSNTPTAASTDVFVDMPLARKAWDWLVERPEILVGRNGGRGHLSLDDALALPEPQPLVPVDPAMEDAEDNKISMAAASLATPAKDGKRKQNRKSAGGRSSASAAAANEDPSTRPRLYATEKTIWYTLTGHDVDYKKVPMLEWQCLQGIASARTKGILQADLRDNVGQDKRSVPKRTDFLAAKGYAVKRTTIARGYRTSMLWLTEFAPVELDSGAPEPMTAAPTTAPAIASTAADDATPALLSSKDLASNGIDFSPEFLTKDLAPVPWRNRWIGDAIEFASFGQTILAIVKAWGVIRVVDLKVKLGIVGLRWQMRTLARASREFVASGILKYVAAMRPDERQLFKDCIKFERDPTPGEWAVYLAAGRRRAPITELRAKRKKELGRLSYAGGDHQSELELDSMAALEEEDEEGDGDGDGDAAGGSSLMGTNVAGRSTPAWALDVPLANLIYDTVDRAGIDGITSPEICRATLGPSFARYVFSLVTAMSRPGSQPDHLRQFQLHCEPARVGKNKAYLFRTLENAKLAERISNGESIEAIEQETAAASAATRADAATFWALRDAGKLFDLPAEELRRLYGFAPLPPPMTAQELAEQEAKFTALHVRKRAGRPKKNGPRGRDRGRGRGRDADGNGNGSPRVDADHSVGAGTPLPKPRRGRPPKVRDVEPEEVDEAEEAGTQMVDVEAVAAPVTPKRRGRPPKVKPVEAAAEATGTEDKEVEAAAEAAEAKTSPPKRKRGRPPKTKFPVTEEQAPVEASAADNEEGGSEADIQGRSDREDEGQDVQSTQNVQNGQGRLEAVALVPVACHYNGKPGHLTVDNDNKTLTFTSAVPRRGRRPANPKEPITIATDNLVGDPVIRRAPGGDGQAFVLEAREVGDGEKSRNDGDTSPQESKSDATWPFVFILDDGNDDNGKLAAVLRDALVALRSPNQPQQPQKQQPQQEEEEDEEEEEEEEEEDGGETTAIQQDGTGDIVPAPNRGRLRGKNNKKRGRPPAETKDFVCETCSGVWKNLLGLQYHQTKARTTCNPNYVPISTEEKEAKKRQQKEEREQEKRLAEQRDNENNDDAGSARGRTVRGRALRERKQPAGAFRESSPLSSTSTRSHSPALSVASESTTASVSPKKEGRQSIKVHGNRRRPYRLQDSDSSDDEPADRPRGIVSAAQVLLGSTEESPSQVEDVDMDTEALNVSDTLPAKPPAKLPAQVVIDDTPMEDTVGASEELATARQKSNTPPPVEEATLELPMARIEEPQHRPAAAPPAALTAAGLAHLDVEGIDSPDKKGPAGFTMPPLPKNGTKLTPSSLRSHIVAAIIDYLVDYYGGIFPGGRSLWYAVFCVYTRRFPGEDPPTLPVVKAAVKKLEMAKDVEEHTFGFRDSRGQFIYCRLLARPGTDLFGSTIAGKFKARIQTTFPQTYVPEDFTPTEKDLAILKILDKESGRNVRGRRALQPEIEVLSAPFYDQPQAARPTANSVRLVGYGDGEDGDSSQQRTPNGKRKATLTAGDIIGGSSAEQTPKRRKTKSTGPATENTLFKALGNLYGGEGQEHDDEADIDPALRTVRLDQASNGTGTGTGKGRSTGTGFGTMANPSVNTGNPGLDSLPASFFLSEDDMPRNRSKTKPVQARTDGSDGFTTFVHLLPPNTQLDDGQDVEEGLAYGAVGQHLSSQATRLPPPRAYKFATKTQRLYDLRRTSPGAWPILSETSFERQSDASFTMDGFMPTRKALVRANLPRTAAECASMLRANQKVPEFSDSPEGIFYRDLEYCRSWEMSQAGSDLLRNPSVAPRYVFLNLAFPGPHSTADDVSAKAAGTPDANPYAQPPLRWLPKNLYSVDTIPYGMLDADDTAANNLAPTTPAQRKKWARSSSELAALREKQTQQAKYVMSSRRELTAYPQKPADYVHHLPTSSSEAGDMDWTANDTLVAAFVVVRTLLGGLGQTIDWGLMMRLFPDKRLSALRNFWKNTRRERQPYIDKFTERFQQAYIDAYEQQAVPSLDYDDVLAYDWGKVVYWALRLMRHDAKTLPATRDALEESHTLIDLPPSRVAGWREDFFHVSRSVWNRLHDTASEAAATTIDKLPPTTPTEAVNAGAIDDLRYMVARSWIRALCGTPHARYQPSSIKRRLLTLGSLGATAIRNAGVLDETATNALLQTVISNLTTDRILRRTKSMIALGGRMYTLTEAYENTLEKSAMEDKFRQAFAFKTELDTCFRRERDAAYEIPVDTNDDGMVMALMNLQAHGRVVVEAIDAPSIPFGFEPGNYESRKFPKHYQRFHTRIVPTDKYVFNDDVDLAAMLQHVATSVTTDGGGGVNADDEITNSLVPPPPRMGAHKEMPIWRDFFGVLDRAWFARLAGAVVFLLATRGATPIGQTAAHLRPIIEPFEVQMLTDWATAAGILQGGSRDKTTTTTATSVDTVDNPPNSHSVSEWWWLLVGQIHVAADGPVPDAGYNNEQLGDVDEDAGDASLADIVEDVEGEDA